MNLLTINANETEPTDYTIRRTVKAVVINDVGKVMLFSSNLIGGGVEEGETDEEALHREALEEAGMHLEIIRTLGEVVAYRDVLKRKYIIIGYLCKYKDIVNEPSQIDPGESKVLIENPTDAIARFKKEIEDLKQQNPSDYEGDTYQAKLYNRQTTLTFLQEVFK